MALPRGKYIRDGQQGVYHCFSRCVRQAYLCGVDMFTKRDLSHRKRWVVDRLRFQTSIFAIEVVAYAVMANHYHVIVRTRPDIGAGWSDWEVAERWLTLFSKRNSQGRESQLPDENRIRALVNCPERIAKLRKRLSSLSWFIGRLNEFIARAANKEDAVKGKFWESRFKCQALLDEPAIAACMVYVDLNPVRAGLAESPEESDFTSIQERIRFWQNENSVINICSQSTLGHQRPDTFDSGIYHPNTNVKAPQKLDPMTFDKSTEGPNCLPGFWLCPIQSDLGKAGILSMSETQYFDLVDRSGRIAHPDKRGTIDADLKPILHRISVYPEEWLDIISHFGIRFYLAAGLAGNLSRFAASIGKKWLKGFSSSRAAFLS